MYNNNEVSRPIDTYISSFKLEIMVLHSEVHNTELMYVFFFMKNIKPVKIK